MPWIEETPPERAEGLLKREYDAARKRAGRIWHIVSIMSPNPEALDPGPEDFIRPWGEG